ncbi:MAG TPA: ribonuclease P protein component [Thermoguttaceae bacterium]|nr:ribonuclease P protein component [Thermoguttaceae bacterium]
MPDFSFPKTYRLRGQKDFQRVFEQKCRAADGWIVLYGWANDLGHPRLGICASARLGPAVHRNRWKRLIREAFRLSKADLPAGLDLVVIPQTPDVPPLKSLQRSLWRLARHVNEKVQKQKARREREARSAKSPPGKSK